MNEPKDIKICSDLILHVTVRNDSLKFYTNDGTGTEKNYLDRDEARRIAAELLAWADTEERAV